MDTPFIECVNRCFHYLSDSYGYRITTIHEDLARWENGCVFIQVRYDLHQSFEVALEIGRLHQEGTSPPYSIGELLGAHGVALHERPLFQARTPERLGDCMSQIAQLLRVHGQGCLKGSDVAFDELAKQRQLDCEMYARDKALSFMRTAADEAWRVRDFKSVADLYCKHTQDLTSAEIARMEYSLKHLRSLSN